MHSWEKSFPSDRIWKNPQSLSFSSTLLDEIYRSIDGGGNEGLDEFKLYRNRLSHERSKSGVNSVKFAKARRNVRDEEEEEMDVHGFSRHCLSEKVKVSSFHRQSLPELYRVSQEVDFDPVPFSSSSNSSSNSSDSSSGGLSSSDVEFIGVRDAKSRLSCFTVLRPKPVKTTVQLKTEKPGKISHYQPEDAHHSFDELPESDGMIKSKLKALKIYNNLKKAKQQPMSPGSGRLTSFLNSLFFNNGGNTKKTTKNHPAMNEDKQSSTKEKITKLRLDTLKVIADQNSQPCKVEEYDDDELSDSSSDLFELDHLTMDKYDQELPVYKTTHIHQVR